MYLSASAPTAPSSVAENSIVCRCARDGAQDAVDLRLEAHVEHPVGLVEDERADTLERDEPALEQVVETTGGRDQDVRLARPPGLRVDRLAAVDRADAKAFGCGERLDVGGHLGGELAGRDEHERRRLAAAVGRALDERQPEGERLAGSRRRLGEDVAARERVGDDELLDRERGV